MTGSAFRPCPRKMAYWPWCRLLGDPQRPGHQLRSLFCAMIRPPYHPYPRKKHTKFLDLPRLGARFEHGFDFRFGWVFTNGMRNRHRTDVAAETGPKEPAPLQFDAHVLRFGKKTKRLHAPFTAHTAFLHASERCAKVTEHPAVHPNDAALQPPCHAVHAFAVRSP